jgi:hypothetical protein
MSSIINDIDNLIEEALVKKAKGFVKDAVDTVKDSRKIPGHLQKGQYKKAAAKTSKLGILALPGGLAIGAAIKHYKDGNKEKERLKKKKEGNK